MENKSSGLYHGLAIVLVLLAGVYFTFYIYTLERNSAKEIVLKGISMSAAALDTDDILNLTGTEKDLDNPSYIYLKQKMIEMKIASGNDRFVYLLGLRDGKIFFFGDSEPPTSPDYSPPGQIYSEAPASFMTPFLNGNSTLTGIYTDRWGTWLTAVAPIINPDDGKVVAELAADINAKNFSINFLRRSSPAALASLFIIILLLLDLKRRKREKMRLELKASLVSMASHEIRSPLTGVVWGLDEILETASKNLSDDQIETITMIRNNCDGMLKTINEFLSIYALKNPKLKEQIAAVDICATINNIISNSALTLREKKLEINFESKITSAYILGDTEKIRGIFSNLISNAIKYSQSGSKITISCEEKSEKYIFSIADRGIGIGKDDQEKIFAGFYRTENAKKLVSQGTGLGLYYVKQIVDMYHGRVWVESKEGEGSTFFVELSKYKPKQQI